MSCLDTCLTDSLLASAAPQVGRSLTGRYWTYSEDVLVPLKAKAFTLVAIIQSLSHVWLFVTPWTATRQASLFFSVSQSLLKLMSIEWVMPSNHLLLCCPLLLLPSMFPNIRVFSNESAFCIRLPKYWSFSFIISLSSDYSGLISFRVDWLDLLAVQGTLKSLVQHHSLKASILWCSAFFMVQLSHPYMTTGKAITLTLWTFVNKVMSLLLSMLSRFVIAFLPRSRCLYFKAVVTIHSDFEVQENKICHCFHFSPSCLLWHDRTEFYDLRFLNVEFSAGFFICTNLKCWLWVRAGQQIDQLSNCFGLSFLAWRWGFASYLPYLCKSLRIR